MSATVKHIPAWKKLGLKLKYSNDTDSSAIQNESAHVTPPKRRKSPMEDGVHVTEPAAKRTKFDAIDGNPLVSPAPVTLPQESTKSHTFDDNDQPRRSKSVSFTADTKSFEVDRSPITNNSSVGSPGSTPKRPGRTKDRKPKSQRSAQIPLAIPRRSRDALDYLNQHYRDRSHWKFNKNREIWILKHVLNVNDIPSEFNSAIAGYIYGLKSPGARARLSKESYDALSTDSGNNSTKGQEKIDATYRSRLAIELSSDNLNIASTHDNDFSSWLEAQTRPVLVLLSLNQNPDVRQVSGITQSRVKKSKARTSRIEIDSSSDSESSSSSSDSDNDSDSSDGTGMEDDDETTSSGSSDSDVSSSSASD